MAQLTRWDPFSGSLIRDFPRSVEDFFRLGFEDMLSRREDGPRAWTPVLNVVETADGFEVEAEVPGLKPEEIKITITDDRLTLQGERRREQRREEQQVHLIERSYGAFQRSLTFPTPVNPEDVRAEADEGILRIQVKKAVTVQAQSWRRSQIRIPAFGIRMASATNRSGAC